MDGKVTGHRTGGVRAADGKPATPSISAGTWQSTAPLRARVSARPRRRRQHRTSKGCE